MGCRRAGGRRLLLCADDEFAARSQGDAADEIASIVRYCGRVLRHAPVLFNPRGTPANGPPTSRRLLRREWHAGRWPATTGEWHVGNEALFGYISHSAAHATQPLPYHL